MNSNAKQTAQKVDSERKDVNYGDKPQGNDQANVSNQQQGAQEDSQQPEHGSEWYQSQHGGDLHGTRPSM